MSLFSDHNVVFLQEKKLACFLTSGTGTLSLQCDTQKTFNLHPHPAPQEEKVGGEDLCNGTLGFQKLSHCFLATESF